MKNLLYLILPLMLLPGCSDNDVPAVPDTTPSAIELHISVQTAPQGRSLTAAAESAITDALVLLFEPSESDASRPGILYRAAMASGVKPTGAGSTFDLRIGIDKDVPPSLVAVIVTNTSAVKPDALAAAGALVGEEYADIAKALVADAPAQTTAMSMWGVCTPAVDTSLEVNTLSAALLRDRARVDVDCASLPAAKFALTSVRVLKANCRIALMPDAANVGNSPIDGSVAVKTPTLCTGDTPDHSYTSSDISGNVCTRALYIPECDILLGGDGDPQDANRLNHAAIIIGGKYGGSDTETYYRVDFTHDGQLVDVMRNHLFSVLVRDVTGPGEDTPEKAYNTIAATVNAEVIDWTNPHQEIVFDGAHWFSAASKHIVLGASAGSSYALAVASDIPADGWQMAWGDDPYSANTPLAGDIFKAVRPSGDVTDGGVLLVEALQDLPEGETQRRRYLHIKVNQRLTMTLTVDQMPDSGDPWHDGGNIDSFYE